MANRKSVADRETIGQCCVVDGGRDLEIAPTDSWVIGRDLEIAPTGNWVAQSGLRHTAYAYYFVITYTISLK